MELSATPADYNALILGLSQNLAAEQLKVIILSRYAQELELKVANLVKPLEQQQEAE